MLKKRFLVAFLLVLFLLLLSSYAFAGCCQGVIGCARAFFNTECAGLSTFDDRECEEIEACDIVACCHNIPSIPKATYRSTCWGMTPPPDPVFIKPFTTNPSAESAYANNICQGASPPCQYVSCEKANSVACMCGSAVTAANSLFCCARDNSVFPSFGACSSSPNCRAGNFFNIQGRVLSPAGMGIEGAEVRAGGKQVITDSNGNFTVELLPDQSSGTAQATKNGTINSTQYTIRGADVMGLVITLDILAAPPQGVEICDNNKDDDGDQFNWDSGLQGKGNAADKCDPDCSMLFFGKPSLKKAVTSGYYNDAGEYYKDTVSGQIKDLCFDNYDNDCNGLEDCEDPVCSVSPACMKTFCGDGVIQFPNANGIYEQCDINYTSGEGNDSLCPGKCVESGNPRHCTCVYEAGCGNGIIDEPLEDCDGLFITARDEWDPQRYLSNSECTMGACGKPNSNRPCQCPPPQVCGNGIIEAPEECDLGTPPPDKSTPNNCDGCSPDCSCPPESAVCGNNLIEKGEDCDGTLPPPTNKIWDSFKARKFSCSKNTCAVPESSSPGNYIGISIVTSNYADYLNNLNVDSACKCTPNCKSDPPGPIVEKVTATRWKREHIINWTDDCFSENVKAFNIYRCTATGPDGAGCECKTDPTDPSGKCGTGSGVYSVINPAPLGLTTFFKDTDFEGSTYESSKYYCYMVEGIYSDMISAPNTRLSQLDREIHCIKAGMEECFSFKERYSWADEFCGGPDFELRSTCDENNTVVPVIDPGKYVNCSNVTEKGFAGSTIQYTCVGPYSNEHAELPGKTQCVPKSICDFCNDPFGLFGYSSSSKSVWGVLGKKPPALRDDFGAAPKSPPANDEIKKMRTAYNPCYTLEMCYMDYSFTSINKFYAYKKPTSCYDFDSLEACKKYNETDSHCEWVWHPLYRELGIGICRTNVTDKQECERCHDPKNEVFNHCNRESCWLYGRCYYDEANLAEDFSSFPALAEMTYEYPVKRAQKEGDYYYKCTPEREIACENYDSKEDCIGSSSPYSIEGVKNLTANVRLELKGNMTSRDVFDKKTGTNKILNKSDDFFSFGKCRWAQPYFINTSYFLPNGIIDFNRTSPEYPEYSCMKNSDGSPEFLKITSDTPEIKEYELMIYSDCHGVGFTMEPSVSTFIPNVTLCRKDFSDPLTNIPHYENTTNPMRIRGRFEFPATVHDESLDYSSYYPDTYACVAEVNKTCYPQGKATKVSREAGSLIKYNNVNYNVSYNFSVSGFQTGRHIIKYFSEDVSHNLELVRNFTVFIDADAPKMVLSFSNVSFEKMEDEWRTNLTITMRVIQNKSTDDKYAFCNAKIYLGNVSIYPLNDIVNEYNDTWTKMYPEMSDDYYTFRYHCEDDVGNVAEANVTFLIEGDRSVTNPQPRLTYNYATHYISVETGTNSECRYLYSPEDNPAFWNNVTFNLALFDTMTLFEVTGSAGSPANIHSSQVTLPDGYHRYYVKCKSFLDNKIRGNNGDQIRFAVDMTAPVSSYTTNANPYGGWYNQDVWVFMACGDPYIMGNGLDWSFKCNSTFYCVGQGCSDIEGEMKLYENEFMLNKTNYISYFSMDAGGNREAVIKDVLFQIDKEPPNMTIEFLEVQTPVNILVMSTTYVVRVNSSKPFISLAISQPEIIYSSTPSKFGGKIDLLPTDNPSVWEGAYFIENINANRGFEGDGAFTVTGTDYHNVSGTSTLKIRIDTKPPDMPTIEPSLEKKTRDASDYQLKGYGIHHYNGTYYTNRSSLFITGYTNEYLDMIAVYSAEDKNSERIFTQTPTTVVHNDSVISGFTGQHEIKIAGDITKRVNASLYIGLDTEQKNVGPKTTYGNYGMFYDMTNLVYRGGDDQYTSVIIYPTLEKSLPVGRKIYFYDKENPSFWFGFDIPLIAFKNTTLYIKAYDAAKNLVRYPDISSEFPYLTFFSDPIAPSILNHYPRSGSTSKTTMDVGLTVKEGKLESGIFEGGINFTFNNKSVSRIIEHDADLETADPANYYYKIYYPVTNLKDGKYEVSIKGSDLAKNYFNEQLATAKWTFTVDRSLPKDPDFKLIDGFRGPPGDERWYATKSPDFIVDFSAEEGNRVFIEDTVMEESPTEGGAATCKNISLNIFQCSFTTPKTSGGTFWADYGVIVKAYKVLGDGSKSSIGEYGPFQFTVDDQPPDFIPVVRARFMDNTDLEVVAFVSNENHPLFADIEFLGEHFTPIYSSNNGTTYRFIWNIHDYNKDKEGSTELKLTLSDFAKNKRSVTLPVYLDLTAPRIENVTFEVSNTIIIGNERFTKEPNVTVSGPFVDDDIADIWLVPGDFNASTQSRADKKYGEMKKNNRGKPESFKISIKLMDTGAGKKMPSPWLYNFMLINQINNVTIFVKDEAGHVSSKKLKVITDIAAPGMPAFCLGEDFSNCVQLTAVGK